MHRLIGWILIIVVGLGFGVGYAHWEAQYPAYNGSDLDCADIGHQVRVGALDPHGLDRDGDGVGCEAERPTWQGLALLGFIAAGIGGIGSVREVRRGRQQSSAIPGNATSTLRTDPREKPMTDRLYELRMRRPYSATFADVASVTRIIDGASERLRSALHDTSADGETAAAVLEAAARSDLASQYLHHVQLVEAFVGSELDTESPGERGLGRMTVGTWPRLGGAYRKQLVGQTPNALATLIEEMVIAGFLVGAALDPLRSGGPYELRQRPPGEAFELWVPALASGYDPSSETVQTLSGIVGEAPLGRFIETARNCNLIGSWRKAHHESQLATIGLLYISAGIALFSTSTSRFDAPGVTTPDSGDAHDAVHQVGPMQGAGISVSVEHDESIAEEGYTLMDAAETDEERRELRLRMIDALEGADLSIQLSGEDILIAGLFIRVLPLRTILIYSAIDSDDARTINPNEVNADLPYAAFFARYETENGAALGAFQRIVLPDPTPSREELWRWLEPQLLHMWALVGSFEPTSEANQ